MNLFGRLTAGVVMTFEPVAVETMKQAINNAWDSLSKDQQQRSTRSDMATYVLAAAADGERDLFVLTEAALKPVRWVRP